ncbi:MAG: hypothetical protein ABIJ92_01190 [Candidatus Aenigmatarchaeota archaeon]
MLKKFAVLIAGIIFLMTCQVAFAVSLRTAFAAATPDSSGADSLYVIQKGDWWLKNKMVPSRYDIDATLYCGTANDIVAMLVTINNLNHPDTLVPGDTVNFPIDREALKKYSKLASVRVKARFGWTADTTTTKVTAKTTSPVREGFIQYTVKKGDVLTDPIIPTIHGVDWKKSKTELRVALWLANIVVSSNDNLTHCDSLKAGITIDVILLETIRTRKDVPDFVNAYFGWDTVGTATQLPVGIAAPTSPKLKVDAGNKPHKDSVATGAKKSEGTEKAKGTDDNVGTGSPTKKADTKAKPGGQGDGRKTGAIQEKDTDVGGSVNLDLSLLKSSHDTSRVVIRKPAPADAVKRSVPPLASVPQILAQPTTDKSQKPKSGKTSESQAGVKTAKSPTKDVRIVQADTTFRHKVDKAFYKVMGSNVGSFLNIFEAGDECDPSSRIAEKFMVTAGVYGLSCGTPGCHTEEKEKEWRDNILHDRTFPPFLCDSASILIINFIRDEEQKAKKPESSKHDSKPVLTKTSGKREIPLNLWFMPTHMKAILDTGWTHLLVSYKAGDEKNTNSLVFRRVVEAAIASNSSCGSSWSGCHSIKENQSWGSVLGTSACPDTACSIGAGWIASFVATEQRKEANKKPESSTDR